MTLLTPRTLLSASLSLAAAAAFTCSAANAQNSGYGGGQQQQPYNNQQPYSQPGSGQQNNGSYGGQNNGSYGGQNNGSYGGQSPNDANDRARDRANDRARGNPATSDLSVPDNDAPHNWTEQQIVTATVHQAWELSGRDETNFFEIVRELAEISAHNRNLALPDDPAAGRRAGQYIRDQARVDHDQLLYAIVDKAVQMTAPKSPQSASARTTH